MKYETNDLTNKLVPMEQKYDGKSLVEELGLGNDQFNYNCPEGFTKGFTSENFSYGSGSLLKELNPDLDNDCNEVYSNDLLVSSSFSYDNLVFRCPVCQDKGCENCTPGCKVLSTDYLIDTGVIHPFPAKKEAEVPEGIVTVRTRVQRGKGDLFKLV